MTDRLLQPPYPAAHLPTVDQGRGICEWCGHAITDDWPAVQPWHPDDPPMHFHACSRLPTEGFPHVR